MKITRTYSTCFILHVALDEVIHYRWCLIYYYSGFRIRYKLLLSHSLNIIQNNICYEKVKYNHQLAKQSFIKYG